MDCPSCEEKAPEGAKWCEACGSDLFAEPVEPCVSCGERDISEDGYCMSCGHKQPEERDHLVVEAGPVVAVTDRGLRHRHNEDAAAIGQSADGGAVLVVCDGVSSTPGSAEASLAAAGAARDVLVGHVGPEGEAGREAVTQTLQAATAAAQAQAAAAPEVISNAPHSQGGPPSSTFVAGVARPVGEAGHEISVAWLGDSRAYWIDGEGAIQLTTDHEIQGSLTHWLGADSVDADPDIGHHTAPGHGRLLLCSDGLWRYAETPAELAALVTRLEAEHPTTGELAAALVEHAVVSGGHDNITVALWDSAAPSPPVGDDEQSTTDERQDGDGAVEADPAPTAESDTSDE